MKTESREFYYDEDLQLEAYQFKGIMQPFPNHFHEYYVIGFIEHGQRRLLCKNVEYHLVAQDIIIFNPAENHDCAPLDNELLDYRALNIPKETMRSIATDISGVDRLPLFHKNVLKDEEIATYLHNVHRMIVENSKEFEKEETLLFLITELLDKNSSPYTYHEENHSQELTIVCDYMQLHYREQIRLKQLCELSSMSSSTLLRAFTKEKGITPYRYLEVIRVNKAKKLLEKGASVLEASSASGFFDQSHFTNFFRTFLGISPGAYRNIFHQNKENDV